MATLAVAVGGGARTTTTSIRRDVRKKENA